MRCKKLLFNQLKYGFVFGMTILSMGGTASVGVASTLAGVQATAPVPTEVISDGLEAWFARYSMISSARNELLIHYYILGQDPFAQAFMGLLHKKLSEGVKVKLMLDVRGSRYITHTGFGVGYLRDLVAHGAIVKVYNPLVMTGVHADIGAANHQKLLIVDQRYFLTGGRNIETDYYARVGMNERIFRDTDIVVDSPEVAAHATRAFYDEFDSPFTYTVKPRALSKNSTQQITERALQAMDERLHNAILKPETAKEFPILDLYKELASYPRYKFLGKASMANLVFAASNSELHEPLGDRKQDINPRLLELINGAKKSIVLTSPYMIPLTDMLEALKRASARGVAITIITNSTASSDSMWTQVVFNQEWPELMKALPGSKLYLANTHETLHSKVYTFDDDIVVVGSYNFDGQGGSMNAEDVVIARSKALAAFVKTDLETYTRDRTTLYTIEDAHERKPVPGPKGEILKQKLLYPIGQQFRESL